MAIKLVITTQICQMILNLWFDFSVSGRVRLSIVLYSITLALQKTTQRSKVSEIVVERRGEETRGDR